MKKFLILWIFSVLLFAVYFVGIFAFMNGFEIIKIILYFAFLLVAVVLFTISNKKLTYPEGYTLIQAAVLYIKCKKNGLVNLKDYDRNAEKAEEIFSNIAWAENLSAQKKRQAFARGRALIKDKKTLE